LPKLDNADRIARDDRGVPALRIDELAHLIVGPSDQTGDGSVGMPHDAIGRFEDGYEIRRDDARTTVSGWSLIVSFQGLNLVLSGFPVASAITPTRISP